MADGPGVRHVGASRCVRYRTARCPTAPPAEAGNGAGVAVVVELDLGHGILEMERYRMGLGSGALGTQTIKSS